MGRTALRAGSGAEPVTHSAAAAGRVIAILLLPLAAPRIGVAAVVAASTAFCALLVAVTIATAAVTARAAGTPR